MNWPAPVMTRLRSTSTSLSDRKSTRLNSSHRTISYAVFCLKKKHVPPWFPPVTAFITVEDQDQPDNFAKAACLAEELREQRRRTPDRKTMHAALRIECCIIE